MNRASPLAVVSGAALGLFLVVGVSVAGALTPRGAAPAPSDAPASAEVVPALTACAVEGMDIEVLPDPGLADPSQEHPVPIYRSYVPARMTVRVCPAPPGCLLEQPPAMSLWTNFRHGDWTRGAAEPAWTEDGSCQVGRYDVRARELWPDQPQGVAGWAVVVGEPQPDGGAPAGWLDAGLFVWSADVVYAGDDGTPDVY